MKLIALSMTTGKNVVLMELSSDGELNEVHTMCAPTPMYACNDGEILYLALREPFGEAESGVVAVRCEERVPQEIIGEPIPCYGRIACHIAYSPDKKYLYTANYRTGSLSEYRLDAHGNIEGLNRVISFEKKDPEKIPHAHGIFFSPDGETLCAPDLGNDCINQYKMTPDGVDMNPQVITFPEGSGPRHLAYTDDGHMAYLVCQNSSMVYALDCENQWKIVASASSEPPANVRNQSSAIRLSPDGKWLYISNRGANTISRFKVEENAIVLCENTPCGNNPRDFAISPDGKWLVLGNMDDDNIAVYAIDPDDGSLTLSAQYDFVAPVAVFFPKE